MTSTPSRSAIVATRLRKSFGRHPGPPDRGQDRERRSAQDCGGGDGSVTDIAALRPKRARLRPGT
jgi:hypothetical protein